MATSKQKTQKAVDKLTNCECNMNKKNLKKRSKTKYNNTQEKNVFCSLSLTGGEQAVQMNTEKNQLKK